MATRILADADQVVVGPAVAAAGAAVAVVVAAVDETTDQVQGCEVQLPHRKPR